MLCSSGDVYVVLCGMSSIIGRWAISGQDSTWKLILSFKDWSQTNFPKFSGQSNTICGRNVEINEEIFTLVKLPHYI